MQFSKYISTTFIFLVLFSFSSSAQVMLPCPDELVPKYDKDKRMWGYCDMFGIMVLEPIFTKVSPFKENKAVVQKGNLSGVINCDGMVLLPLQYEKLTDFRNDKIWAKKNGAWGLLDFKGRTILAHVYTDINPISGTELTWVEKDKMWTLVDESQNKVLCATPYDFVQVMSPNASLVKSGEVFGVLNHVNCNYLLPLTIAHVKRVTQHELLFEEKGKWGIFHFAGKIISNPIYDSIALFQPNVFIVKKGNKYGLIDQKGIEKLPLVYDEIGEYSSGYCAVKQNGKYGYATRFGQVYIPVVYEAAKPFQKGQAAVKKNGKWGIIDVKNQVVLDFQFDEISYNETLWFLQNNLTIQLMALGSASYQKDQIAFDRVHSEDQGASIRVEKGNRYQFCNASDGRISFEGEYEFAEPMIDDFAIVSKGTDFGLINSKGQTVLPFEFQQIKRADKTAQTEWFVKKGNVWGLCNEKKTIWPETFSWVYACGNGLYKVAKNNKVGIVNYKMEPQGELIYDAISFNTEPEWPAVVSKSGKSGLITTAGLLLVSVKYDSIATCGDGYFKAKSGKTLYLITPTGLVTKTKYTDFGMFSEGLVPFKAKEYWGYCSSSLTEEIPAQFEACGKFVKGIAPAKQQGKVGLINRMGVWVLKPEYDNYVQDANTKGTILLRGEKQYLVNERGKVVLWEE